MKVKFTGNYPKTIDGQQVGPFRMGEVRDLDDALARKLVASSMAEVYVEPVQEVVGDTAADDSEIVVQVVGDPEPRRVRRRPPAED